MFCILWIMILKNGGGYIQGIRILNPDELRNQEKYDWIIMGTLMGLQEVQDQLLQLGVPVLKLNKSYVEISVKSRLFFLRRYSERVYKEGLDGAVAEAGVFRGEFAKEINRIFPDRTCYLFDTFEGFDEKDFAYEAEESMTEDARHLKMTSEKLVYNKMPYKENIVIKKGYFPETTDGIEDKFVFVNLDMDLYRPTFEGLRFFWPRLVKGGVILIHDYFTEIYPNVEKAVDDFEREMNMIFHKIPIGDDISIALIK